MKKNLETARGGEGKRKKYGRRTNCCNWAIVIVDSRFPLFQAFLIITVAAKMTLFAKVWIGRKRQTEKETMPAGHVPNGTARSGGIV